MDPAIDRTLLNFLPLLLKDKWSHHCQNSSIRICCQLSVSNYLQSIACKCVTLRLIHLMAILNSIPLYQRICPAWSFDFIQQASYNRHQNAVYIINTTITFPLCGIRYWWTNRDKVYCIIIQRVLVFTVWKPWWISKNSKSLACTRRLTHLRTGEHLIMFQQMLIMNI